MNPDKIKIATEREFEYEKISRTIDKMDDIDDVIEELFELVMDFMA